MIGENQDLLNGYAKMIQIGMKEWYERSLVDGIKKSSF